MTVRCSSKASCARMSVNNIDTARIIDVEPDRESLGMWSAYVEKGQTKEERNLRLNAVPERMKEQVKNHVVTVFKLRKIK